MKNLFKNIGIRGKLSLLTALYVLGMSIFGGVAYNTLSKVKVNGPLYTEIVKGKDLVADILPPPMYIIESYLITHQIADEDNPAELERLTKKAKTLHDEYNTRYEVWKKELPEGKLKTALLEKAHNAAVEFYTVQESEFAAAMLKDDHEAARTLAGGKLKKLFETQRDAIAEVVNLATEHNTATEASANTSIATGTWMLIGICIGLAGGLTAIALWIAAGIIRVVNQNVASMEAATKQDYSLRPTIQAGGELGRMNVALNSMLDSLTSLEATNIDYAGQVKAIGKSNAVIEFNPDGTIITANENFLTTLGYSLNEIVGVHHRTFVDPIDAASPDYAKMWHDLNNGLPMVGQFRRIAKGGKEIFIQGSYNPVFDRNGKLLKVVKYATDITAAKRLEKQIEEKAKQEQQLAAEQARKVDQLLRVVNNMADGDFAQAVPDMGEDAVGQVAQAVNKAMDSVRDALHQVREVALTVGSSSAELASASEEIASGAQEQASSLEETAASLEEITSAVKQNTDNAQQAQQLAHTSRQTAEVGGTVVGDAVNAMTAINDASKKIAEIITTIDEIAFQTNLLALNAAVEAARAGEQGRGFAVVASEVRSLAQRSASAAREIKNLIQDSVCKVQNGTALVNKSGDTLKEIVNSVKRVADIVTEISSASTEQLTGIEQVNNAVSQMDRVTQTNAAQTEEMSSTSQNLLSHAEHLQQLVARFRLGSDDGAGVEAAPIQTRKPARSSSPKKTKSTPIAPVSTGGAHELDMIGLPGGDFGQAPGTFVEF